MNKIINNDVLVGLKEIPTNSVHLIVCSPPYNAGITYDGYSDDIIYSNYLSWLQSVWQECFRVLIDGGRICINIDNVTNLDEKIIDKVHPLHVYITNQLQQIGYIFYAQIDWIKGNAPGKATAFGSFCSCSSPHIRRNSEYIIVAAKNKTKLDGDSSLCDLTTAEFMEWTLSAWFINPETDIKGHPCPYPKELAKRFIKLFSYVGNTVLDPFCGSGTTLSVALENGRNYIGIDQSKKYCNIAESNINRVKKELEISGGYNFKPSNLQLKEKLENKKQHKLRHTQYEEPIN